MVPSVRGRAAQGSGRRSIGAVYGLCFSDSVFYDRSGISAGAQARPPGPLPAGIPAVVVTVCLFPPLGERCGHLDPKVTVRPWQQCAAGHFDKTRHGRRRQIRRRDPSRRMRIGVSARWRVQLYLETIRAAANPK